MSLKMAFFLKEKIFSKSKFKMVAHRPSRATDHCRSSTLAGATEAIFWE